jgi:hypothetical protein
MPWPFRRGRTVNVTVYTSDKRTQERTVDDEDSFVMLRCAYDPGSTRENEDGSQVTQSPRVFGPYDAAVPTDATITVAGVDGLWEVDGEILRWRNDLTGTEACCEIKLTRKRGQV